MTIIDLSQRVQSKQTQTLVTYSLTLLLLASPLWFGLQRAVSSMDHRVNDRVHALDAAEVWIDENVQKNEQILYYGYYTGLPKILDPNPNEQAIYGDYFMYQRGNNEYWIERFSQFIISIPSRGLKTYDIIYQIGFQVGEEQKSFYLRYEMGEDEQFLYPYVSQSGIPYVVTHYDLQKYPQFQNALAWSSRGKGLPGGDVFIYEIK